MQILGIILQKLTLHSHQRRPFPGCLSGAHTGGAESSPRSSSHCPGSRTVNSTSSLLHKREALGPHYFIIQSHLVSSLSRLLKVYISRTIIRTSMSCEYHLDKILLLICFLKICAWDFPGGPVVKNAPANAADSGLIPGLGRFHMSLSNQVHEPQLLSPQSQLLKPVGLESVPHNKRSHCNGNITIGV